MQSRRWNWLPSMWCLASIQLKGFKFDFIYLGASCITIGMYS
ncbi:unnamed protein product, partial [Vitis vinifera]|uniref:Uncharacterized protein n=1 Tax=Vitis vinifera TaxID=29760 RepID=D7TRH8_VITVI